MNDTVTLNGTLYGIRDATLIHMFDHGRTTRFDMKGHAVVHTAPNVKWVGETRGASVGLRADLHRHDDERAHGALHASADGRSTAFASSSARAGSRRARLDAFRDLGGVYLAIVGGAAALETTWVEQIEEVDLDDLNPESLWKFRVKGFGPLLVSMDSHGGSLYTQVNNAARERAPRRWPRSALKRSRCVSHQCRHSGAKEGGIQCRFSPGSWPCARTTKANGTGTGPL